MNQQHCPICQSSNLSALRRGSTDLLRCSTCDVVVLATLPTASEQAEYYEHSYMLSRSANSLAELRRISRWSENVRLINGIKGVTSPSPRLLDVGCDRGFFLDEARRWGYDVFGMEPSAQGREYAQVLGLPVSTALEQYSDQKFDVITMWHVLEHISNPIETLQQLSSMMSSGSQIHIRVPNFASLSSKILGSRWIWFQPENHVFHYSVKSLDTLLRGVGFEVEFVRSQRPNSLHTLIEFWLTNRALTLAGAESASLRSWASTLVQYLSGVELYAVARAK